MNFKHLLKREEDHISDEVKALVKRGHLSSEEWKALRLNSWEREALIPVMNNDLLVSQIRYTIQNCERFCHPATIYEQALQIYAEEAARRLESKPLEAYVESCAAFRAAAKAMGRKGGKACLVTMTPAERSARGRLAVTARWRKARGEPEP